jgi:hypothetical protein
MSREITEISEYFKNYKILNKEKYPNIIQIYYILNNREKIQDKTKKFL